VNRRDVSPVMKARFAIGQAVIRMVEAEGFLEDASVLSPEAEEELLRLKQALHELGIAALDARGLLENGNEKEKEN
jgi:4-aminobutyrate aminotransferase-like enzyme